MTLSGIAKTWREGGRHAIINAAVVPKAPAAPGRGGVWKFGGLSDVGRRWGEMRFGGLRQKDGPTPRGEARPFRCGDLARRLGGRRCYITRSVGQLGAGRRGAVFSRDCAEFLEKKGARLRGSLNEWKVPSLSKAVDKARKRGERMVGSWDDTDVLALEKASEGHSLLILGEAIIGRDSES